VGPAAGELAAACGWPVFFLFTFFIALPGLALLAWARARVEVLDAGS
jgi:PAT family beta-lactamase induction signal transducer AmpG